MLSARRSRSFVISGMLVMIGGITATFFAFHVDGERGEPGRPVAAPTTTTSASAATTRSNDIVVHTGAEAGERDSVKQVVALLAGIPGKTATGTFDWLADGAAASSADMSAAVPANAVVTADGSSWRRTGSVGSITATVSQDEQAQTVRVILIHQADGWKVSETYPETSR
jgi:hypothetical protein